mmetsp:Transcript_96903/g.301653  ORF Transcript_96903/g.301653 Transcript_96903/m.301653 type:complete len:208 (+) Transcript_96903:1335-1958(+)
MTDSSGMAPAKPAGSAPNTTACTVAMSCLKVRKQSLFPCLRLLCTRARSQTLLSLSSGVREMTGVHSRLVLHSLWMKTLPNACPSKFSSVKSGPLNLASLCFCCSSSLLRFSSSLAFFASSLAFFFSSFLLFDSPPSPAASVAGSAFAGFGAAFAGCGSAFAGCGAAFATAGAGAAAAGALAAVGTALSSRKPSWCTQVNNHRTVFG